MSFCTGCGAPLNDGRRFCVQCGQAAPAAGLGATQAPTAQVNDGDDVFALLRAGWDKARAPRLHLGVTLLSVLAFALTYALAVLAQWAVATHASDGDSGLIDWARGGAAWMLGDLGGAMTMKTHTESIEFVDTESSTVSLSTVVFLVVLVGLLAALTRLTAARVGWRPAWPAAVTAALLGGLTVAVLSIVTAVATRGPIGPLFEERTDWGVFGIAVSAVSASVFLMPLALATFLLLTMLWPTKPSDDGAAAKVGSGLRLGWRISLVLLVAGALLLAADYWPGIDGLGSLSATYLEDESWVGFVALMPWALVQFSAIALGATHAETYGSADEATTGLFAETLPWATYLLPVLSTVLVAVVLLRFRLTRSRTHPALVELCTAALVGVLLPLWIVALAADRGENFRAGLRLEETFVALFLVMSLALLVVTLLSRWLVGWTPRFSARLAGRRVHPTWAAALVERIARDGRIAPAATRRAAARLEEAEDEADEAPAPPPVAMFVPFTPGTEPESAPTSAPTAPAAPKPLPGGSLSPVLALVLLAASTTLLLVPLDESDVESCASPWSAYRASAAPLPLEVPPADVKTELDRLAGEITQAEGAVTTAKSKSTVGADLKTRLDAAIVARDEATAAAAQTASALSDARDEVADLADVGEWERSDLEEAQELYDEFREYDDDGFWADNLQTAKDALAEAEEPLRDAEATRDEAQAAHDATSAVETKARTKVARLDRQLAPHLTSLSTLTTAENALEKLSDERADLDAEWRADHEDATEAVKASNSDVETCRDRARSRVWGAGAFGVVGLLLLVSSLSTGVSRRRVQPQPQPQPDPQQDPQP